MFAPEATSARRILAGTPPKKGRPPGSKAPPHPPPPPPGAAARSNSSYTGGAPKHCDQARLLPRPIPLSPRGCGVRQTEGPGARVSDGRGGAQMCEAQVTLIQFAAVFAIIIVMALSGICCLSGVQGPDKFEVSKEAVIAAGH